MSQLSDLLQDTANAIREKNGNGLGYSPSQFEEGILSIPSDLEDKYIPISYISKFSGGLNDFIEVIDLSRLIYCDEISSLYNQSTTSNKVNSTHTTIYLPNHDNEIKFSSILMNWSMANYKQVELHARNIYVPSSLFHMRGGNNLVFLLDYEQMTTRGIICDCSQGTTIKY